jgi:DNA-binding NarL/FixJ family response regulator
MTGSQRPTRVLVADRSAEVCHALGRLLGAEQDIDVTGTAQTEDELLAAMAGAAPDVVLLDYQLPRRSVNAVVTSLRALVPDVAVLVLLVHPGDVAGVTADERTAWILKDSDGRELRTQVRALAPAAS